MLTNIQRTNYSAQVRLQNNNTRKKMQPAFSGSMAKSVAKGTKYAGKHVFGASLIASHVARDLFTTVLAGPPELVARTITHGSKGLKKLGLTKKSVDISFIRRYGKAKGFESPYTFIEGLKRDCEGIVNLYKDMGLTKSAQILGKKLW